MSQQIRVGRDLVFTSAASIHPNIEGNPMFDKVVYYDDFLGDAIRDEWNPVSDNGGTVAITAASGGTVTLTTSTVDNDRAILTQGLNWYCAKKPFVFAKVKVDAITTVGLNVGFSDALTEGDDHLAFEISGTTIVDTCTDGACWVFDTDATNDYWHYCNTKNGTQAGTAYGTNAPVAATYVWLGVGLDTSGNATFYYNGNAVGYKASAVTTSTALTPFFGVISRAGSAARVMSIDKVYIFQDEE